MIEALHLHYSIKIRLELIFNFLSVCYLHQQWQSQDGRGQIRDPNSSMRDEYNEEQAWYDQLHVQTIQGSTIILCQHIFLLYLLDLLT